MNRRDMIIAGAAFTAAGLSYGLKPRRTVSLLGKAKMEAIVPTSLPHWPASGSQGLVKPKAEGLAASLYNEIVQRTYRNDETGGEIMVLIAHGAVQSDVLQLHRPEVCYPAVGFRIAAKSSMRLPLPGGQELPVVKLVAVAGDRVENIMYWTRVGEEFPTKGSEQRTILLKSAMAGYIPDGVLVRCSTVDDDSERAFRTLTAFIPQMLLAINPSNRPALIATRASQGMGLQRT